MGGRRGLVLNVLSRNSCFVCMVCQPWNEVPFFALVSKCSSSCMARWPSAKMQMSVLPSCVDGLAALTRNYCH